MGISSTCQEGKAVFDWMAPELGLQIHQNHISCYGPGTDISLECYGSRSYYSPNLPKVGRGRMLAGVMLASEENFIESLAMGDRVTCRGSA